MVEPAADRAVYLWDWPVRITHWGFALLLPAMWWTAEEGEMERHQQLGLLFLGLLVFRVLWGFGGSAPARFGQFVKGPGAVLAYVRGTATGGPVLGHNPLGGWSIAALLALIAVQIGLGLISQDVDGLFSGPLNHLVSYDTGDAARGWHELSFNILAGLVVVHIFAVGFYLFVRRDNLITPMLSGRKRVDGTVADPRRGSATALIASAVAAVGVVTWVWFGAPPLGD